MTTIDRRALVTGAGGFIGHHLVRALKRDGWWVRGADLKYPEFAASEADEFLLLDLTRREHCLTASAGVSEVYALAADIGGMGYIATHNAAILRQNTLISTHSIEAAHINGVERYFHASSACVYPEFLQERTDVRALREEDAYPAQPQDAYGWEKLITERLCTHYREDYGLETRIARFHNIYGPLGTWRGGREKVPAAMCRKIASAKLTGAPAIEIWGDGQQTRSFCHIDDCVDGILRLMRSSHTDPVNIGQDQLISIDALADMVAEIAGITIVKQHVPGPQGVRGRNCDSSRVREVLGWIPRVSLQDGMAETYAWVEGQLRQASVAI
jgi:GDP-D-mannose 3', 5'-epimerase